MAEAPAQDTASRQERLRRATAAYGKFVKPNLMPADNGKLVALDLDSGDFEIGTDELETIHRLRARRPAATAWMFRVGSPYLHRIGWGGALTAS